MGTDPSFVEHVADQAGLGARLSYKKMFGEYGLYVDGKMVALACDNSLFIKPSPAVEKTGREFALRPPYPGAKPHPLIDDLLDEPSVLQSLFVGTAAALPAPKPKGAAKRPAGKR